MELLLLILAIIALLLLRVPVAFALLGPSLVYLWFTPGMGFNMAFEQVTSGVNSFPLVAIPLFILTGYVANASGYTDELFEFLCRLLARVRGRLAYVNVYSSLGFSWISGASTADIAGLGSVIIPQMRARGYPNRYILGLTAASATIGPVMPPSVAAIIYGVTAGVSIGSLFAAGIVPAVLVALVLTIWVYVWARRNKEVAAGDRVEAVGSILMGLFRSSPILLAPIIIVGGILGGVFTPTEAGGIAAVWLLLVSFAGRRLTVRKTIEVLISTARTTSLILVIIACTSLLAWILARERAPQLMANAILGISENPIMVILLINVIVLLVGTMLDTISGILVMVPVLLPVAELIGLDPIQLGVILIFNLTIGGLTPPIGVVLYILSSVSGNRFGEVVVAVTPFLVPLIIVLLLVSFIPLLTLWLPMLAAV